MKIRSSALWALRVIGTIALLAILLTLIDLSSLYTYATRVHPAWLIMTMLALLCVRVLMAIRWHLILRASGVASSLGEVVRVTFLASTLAPLVPGGLGADVFRGYHFVGRYGRAADLAGTLLLDRVVGIYSMLLVANFGALAAWWLGFGGGLLVTLLVVQAAVLAGWAVVERFKGRAGRLTFRNPMLAKGFRALVAVMRPLVDRALLRKVLPVGILLSLAVQLLRCLSFWFLYEAFFFGLSFVYFLAFIPLIFLASMLPVSVGGLGLREGALVYFFGALGVPAAVSFAVGILWYALQIGLSVLIVGIWFGSGGARALWRQGMVLWRPQR